MHKIVINIHKHVLMKLDKVTQWKPGIPIFPNQEMFEEKKMSCNSSITKIIWASYKCLMESMGKERHMHHYREIY